MSGTNEEPGPRVTCEVRAGVADVRLNRPEKLNALDPAMFAALVATSERLQEDRSVRVVVLSGEGRAFCAGLDLEAFQAMAADGQSGAVGNLASRSPSQAANRGQRAAYAWSELPVPVIAAIKGVALGGGLQIALGADLRIVAPDARLSVLEIRWGLIPDMTGTYTLPRLVGPDVAKELTWTGRMVSGEEAVRLGLATRVAAEPLAEALALAEDLAAHSPAAVQGAKALLNQSGGFGPQEQFEAEERTMKALMGSPAQQEAVRAYFEKRPPVFADLD